MSPEVLLSAMYLEDERYVDTLNIRTDCVVINQCDREREAGISHETPSGNIDITYVETKERGLSKSRNMAVSKAKGDICVLCDNDVEYVEGYDRIINDAFTRFADADVLIFFISRPERRKPVFDRPRRMGYLSVLKIFSPEIAFRRKSIEGIRFNELFGAGAKYCMGEENLFLYDCLKKKKKIMYIPEMIAAVRDEESTWFKGFDKRFFISRGANYAAMSKSMSFLLMIQFAVRKRNLYAGNMKMMQALEAMFEGRREYLDLK